MKGYCPIPTEARRRGSREQTNKYKFTEHDYVRAGQATCARNLTREARVKGGKATGVNKRFGAHKRWHRDRRKSFVPVLFCRLDVAKDCERFLTKDIDFLVITD